MNKLKVVKRIMYGRNSLELLKGKLLRLESKRKIFQAKRMGAQRSKIRS